MAGAFFAVVFFAVVVFFAAVFLAGAFFAGVFLAVVFLVVCVFFAGAFLNPRASLAVGHCTWCADGNPQRSGIGQCTRNADVGGSDAEIPACKALAPLEVAADRLRHSPVPTPSTSAS